MASIVTKTPSPLEIPCVDFPESCRSSFAWQLGYGAFSVSKSNVPEVGDYIRNQEGHHRKFNQQEELVALLRKHRIEYDERYLWD